MMIPNFVEPIHANARSCVLGRVERCGLLWVTRAEFHTRKIELLERAVGEFGMIQVAFDKREVTCSRFLHAHIMRWRAMPTFDRRDVVDCDSVSLAVSRIEAAFSVTAGSSPGDRNSLRESSEVGIGAQWLAIERPVVVPAREGRAGWERVVDELALAGEHFGPAI